MATNLTITVDEEILKRARLRALEQGTSVNAVLAEHLRRYAGVASVQESAVRSLVALARENRRSGGDDRATKRGPRTWKRADLHER